MRLANTMKNDTLNMSITKFSIFFTLMLIYVGCNERSTPIVKVDSNLSKPIQCMALDGIGVEKKFSNRLNQLYNFTSNCPLKLSIKYKKDIVCNSPYNPNQKNVSKFPKSFLNIELREGFDIKYSYYVDLYSNVDEEDIEEGFLRVTKDLLQDSSSH